MTEFLTGILRRLGEEFDPQTMGSELARLLSNLIVAALTFAVFWAAWKILHRLARPVLRRSGLDATAITFVETTLKYVLLTIGAVAALGEMGINTASLLTSLGIAGLTLGFAARDALSNIISGIFIFWDRPFVLGDLIEVQGNYGRVERITLRSSRVVTVDGKMLAIPNSTMVNSTVASYTNFPHLRLDVDVTIAVTEDIERARRLLLQLVQEEPSFLTDPAPRVVVKELNDYNVRLELQAWIANEREHIARRFDLREKIFRKLSSAGVDMPFETFRLAPLQVEPIRVAASAA